MGFPHMLLHACLHFDTHVAADSHLSSETAFGSERNAWLSNETIYPILKDNTSVEYLSPGYAENIVCLHCDGLLLGRPALY